MAHVIPFSNFPTIESKLNMFKQLTQDGKQLFSIYDDFVATPFLYKRPNGIKGTFATNHTFCGQLSPNQTELVNQAANVLKNKSSVLLTVYCGGGKTVMTIWLLAQIGLPVLIVVPKIALVNQWHERIKQFCPSLVYHIQTGRKKDAPPNYSVLVLDEVHQLFSPHNLNSILKISPQFLIGATATPWRPNEDDKFKWFFADRLSFSRPAIKSSVWVILTHLKPPIKENEGSGRLDWNAILNWQASDPDRIAKIISTCRQAPTPQLILIKRVEAAKLLNFDPENTQIICGKDHSIDIHTKTNYVIATFSKLGTGFDFAQFKTLVLTSDVVEYFEQFAGRILRSNQDALFIDVVDDFGPLWGHFQKRCQFYNSLKAKFKYV